MGSNAWDLPISITVYTNRLLRRLGSARRGGERGGGTLYLTPTAQEGICPLLLSELADPQLASNRKLHDELLHRRPQRDRLHRGRHLRHGTPWEECILVSCRHSAPLRSKQGGARRPTTAATASTAGPPASPATARSLASSPC